MKKAKWFKCDLFDTNYIFFYGVDYKEIKKDLMNLEDIFDKSKKEAQVDELISMIKKYENTYSGFVCQTNIGSVIWVRKFPKSMKDPSMSILIHEINHSVNDTFSHVNMNHVEENDEVYSYLIELLYKKIVIEA